MCWCTSVSSSLTFFRIVTVQVYKCLFTKYSNTDYMGEPWGFVLKYTCFCISHTLENTQEQKANKLEDM